MDRMECVVLVAAISPDGSPGSSGQKGVKGMKGNGGLNGERGGSVYSGAKGRKGDPGDRRRTRWRLIMKYRIISRGDPSSPSDFYRFGGTERDVERLPAYSLGTGDGSGVRFHRCR